MTKKTVKTVAVSQADRDKLKETFVEALDALKAFRKACEPFIKALKQLDRIEDEAYRRSARGATAAERAKAEKEIVRIGDEISKLDDFVYNMGRKLSDLTDELY